jgi:hypothetical protein
MSWRSWRLGVSSFADQHHVGDHWRSLPLWARTCVGISLTHEIEGGVSFKFSMGRMQYRRSCLLFGREPLLRRGLDQAIASIRQVCEKTRP